MVVQAPLLAPPLRTHDSEALLRVEAGQWGAEEERSALIFSQQEPRGVEETLWLKGQAGTWPLQVLLPDLPSGPAP